MAHEVSTEKADDSRGDAAEDARDDHDDHPPTSPVRDASRHSDSSGQQPRAQQPLCMTRVQQADFTLEFDRCTLLSGSKHAWAPFHCMSDALDYGLLCLQQMNGSRASARSYCAASDLHSWLCSNYPPEEGWNFRRAEAAAQKLVAHLPAPMRLQISPASSKEAAGELILLDPITALVELVRRWGDELKLKYTPRTNVAGDRVYSEPHECNLFEKVTMFAREKNGGRTWVCLYACGNLSDTRSLSH